MGTSKEVAVFNPNSFQVANVEQISSTVLENFEGLVPVFSQIRFPSGGAVIFELDSEPEKYLEGVIICHYSTRALFTSKFGGGDDKKSPPACSSIDGRIGTGLGKETSTGFCRTCSFNEFGSFSSFVDPNDKSNKKACAVKHRLFLLRSGELFPILLALPITSIKNLEIYMTRIASRGKNYKTVITQIGLERVKNANNIEFAIATFKNMGDVPEEKVKSVMEVASFLDNFCRNKPITGDEEDDRQEDFSRE